MKSILLSAYRLMPNGVMYLLAFKDDVPTSSVSWIGRGIFSRFDTRQKLEQNWWAMDVPVLNSETKLSGLMVKADIDDRGALHNIEPVTDAKGCAERWL